MYKYACLLVFFASPAVAQVFFFGPCPDYPVVRRFKAERFSGKWYENQRYFDAHQDLLGSKCVTETFQFLSNGTILIYDQQFPTDALAGIGKVKVASGTYESKETSEAKFVIQYAENLLPLGPTYILETDYKSFAIKWSCINYHLFSLQYVWVLTRERKPNPEIIQRAEDELEILGLSPTHLKKTDQTNCPDI